MGKLKNSQKCGIIQNTKKVEMEVLMMKYQIFNIVFSIMLLPTNVCCAFWLFREALNLTGMTFGTFVKKVQPQMLHINNRRHRTRRVQRILAGFFYENSSNPQKSIRLSRMFGFCTLPGLVALTLAIYSAMSLTNIKYAFIGNIILAVVNIAILICGIIYRRKNPIDEMLVEKINSSKNVHKRKNKIKNIVVYSIIGAVLLGVLLFFMMGILGISHSDQNQSAISIRADLITILNEKDYETSNIPTTYWELDENKLEHIAAGVKGNSKFEFYGYSDDETVDLVYNQIIYFTVGEMENTEIASHETTLPNGNKMFTAKNDGVYYLVMYQNDTVIYAYSPDSLNEINEILTEIGYLKSR